ncbi:unnamed protein product [Rotaria magnacalcarata]|nr:unnamed protein product [Rotaria magnacalcarata]CAF4197499.1 unnamed protein product [Rotaria magnacalcarata]
MVNKSNSQYLTVSNKDKDDLCDHNHEIIEELILSKNKSDSLLNKNRFKTQNDEGSHHFNRQLTSTSQYEDSELQDDDNNPFIFISKGCKEIMKRAQRIVLKTMTPILLNKANQQNQAATTVVSF